MLATAPSPVAARIARTESVTERAITQGTIEDVRAQATAEPAGSPGVRLWDPASGRQLLTPPERDVLSCSDPRSKGGRKITEFFLSRLASSPQASEGATPFTRQALDRRASPLGPVSAP